MLSLTECVWDFQSNALWDTQEHAILKWKTHDSAYGCNAVAMLYCKP